MSARWHRFTGEITQGMLAILIGVPLFGGIIVGAYYLLAELVAADWTLHRVGEVAAVIGVCVAPTAAACVIGWRMNR